jgi:protein O-mannosyl-transferase
MARRHTWLVGLGLFIITLALYWPVTSFPFVGYDDEYYVYENTEVLKGVSGAGLKWAGTAFVAGNWHPVTVVSHMVDCSFYGSFAGGHHLTNLLFHAVNVLLVWVLFRQLLASFWGGTLVAALFAWHPMNVESVAWVAERKNVLSTFFWLLTLLAYLKYVAGGRGRDYLLALVCFLLGLLSKPMLVTLPCLLLVLDWWPLRRVEAGGKTWRALVLEKLPFFLLTGVVVVMTLVAQQASGAVRSLEDVPWGLRLANVPVAYVNYLAKLAWPTELCAFYALPTSVSLLSSVGSGVVLLGVTGWFFSQRRSAPWLLMGWLGFVGTLVPVIGIVQVGAQSMADRYAYIPALGVFGILAGALVAGTRDWPVARSVGGGVMAILLSGCLWLTHRQLGYWHSSVELFQQAVRVNPGSAEAHEMLGTMLSGAGQTNAAIEQYEIAVGFQPRRADFQYHLGRELLDVGRLVEAEKALTQAVDLKPDTAIFHNTLGVVYWQQGNFSQATNAFSRAIQVQPGYGKAYFNRGRLEWQLGLEALAAADFTRAVQAAPDWAEALDRLAWLRLAAADTGLRNPVEARQLALQANALTGGRSADLLRTLALAWAASADYARAMDTARLAQEIARTNHQADLTGQLTAEIEAYQAGRMPVLAPRMAK